MVRRIAHETEHLLASVYIGAKAKSEVALLPPANEVCEGYVFTPVCQSFCSQGVSASVYAGIHTPPWADTPSGQTPPMGRHPLGRYPLSRHPPAQTPPREQTPPWGADTSGSRHPPGADTPCAVHAGRYGQQAGSTHPAGMHTCFQMTSK